MGNDGDAEERAAKRARVASDPLNDAMAATRDQLARTTDPHLQAKLLLQYSAQAVAPTAATEAAIDFLFAFLQQSQSAANGDQTKSPPNTTNSSNNGGGNNAVVVAAIVRGLRELLAVKPHLVEPMIQLDAMGEQLTQCISVPEDFKLRRDMLRIVLDCLISARKFREIEQLLRACVADHDDRLCTASLDGYIRMLSAGHRLDATVTQELAERLRDMLLQCDDARTRAMAAQLVGKIAETSFESAASSAAPLLQENLLNTLASVVRDPSPRVRLQVATAFRCFRAATSPEALYAHLLHKRQIDEDLAEINTQSVAMLTSGAMLSLLEDDTLNVALAMSTSMRVLCDGGLWSSDLVDRAVATHIELAARVGYCPELVVDVLRNLETFLKRWDAMEKTPYPMSREELSYLLGSLPTTSFVVTCEVFRVLCVLSVDTPHKASRVALFLVHCSQCKTSEATDEASVLSLRSSIEQLVGQWVEHGLVLPADVMATLRGVASGSSAHAMTASCQLVHDALCLPTDRLVELPAQRPTIRTPSFLSRK